MGEIADALRRVSRRDSGQRQARMQRSMTFRPRDEAAPWLAADTPVERKYKVVTITNKKGGVGKTTLAANLGIFLAALRDDLPVLVIGLDDQSLIDRMFELQPDQNEVRTVADGLRAGSFRPVLQLGQYGVHYVPSTPLVEELEQVVSHTGQVRAALDSTGWEGIVVLDTGPDLGLLTRNAIAASDLVVVPIGDDPSLREADKVFALMERGGMDKERGRALLSRIDRRIKYRDGEETDVLGLLIGQIRERGYPMFESFVSRSPRVESLSTNPDRRARSILAAAPRSIVTMQMRLLAEELLKTLDRIPVENAGRTRVSEGEASWLHSID